METDSLLGAKFAMILILDVTRTVDQSNMVGNARIKRLIPLLNATLSVGMVF